MHVFDRRVELRPEVVQCTSQLTQPTNLIGQKIWPTSKKWQNYGPKIKMKTQLVEKKNLLTNFCFILSGVFLAVYGEDPTL